MNMLHRRCLALLALALTLLQAPAHAHKPSDSYLTLNVADSGVSGRWDIALRDLDVAIGLDADGDGAITLGSVGSPPPRPCDAACGASAR